MSNEMTPEELYWHRELQEQRQLWKYRRHRSIAIKRYLSVRAAKAEEARAALEVKPDE
jgi:hypothetical protein